MEKEVRDRPMARDRPMVRDRPMAKVPRPMAKVEAKTTMAEVDTAEVDTADTAEVDTAEVETVVAPYLPTMTTRAMSMNQARATILQSAPRRTNNSWRLLKRKRRWLRRSRRWLTKW